MNGLKIGALLLILAGTIGLVFSPFSYNGNTQRAVVGPVGLAVTEQRTVNVPEWASVGAILVGSVVLLVRKERSRAW